MSHSSSSSHAVQMPQGITILPRRLDLGWLDEALRPEWATADHESVYAYLDIPYARPPIGPLRWKPPQRPAAASSQDAPVKPSRWGPDPPQNFREQFSLSQARNDRERTIGQSEDCLKLNIWIPERVKARMAAGEPPSAVAVWIYGGGFATGSTSMALHDGARLAATQSIILVSVQYRVGVFGFLGGSLFAEQDLGPDPYFSDLLGSSKKKSIHGNWGMWDAAAGMQWVQDHIRLFGGDPNQVTAFGESAGSILIHYLMLSPALPRLFSRAILQSGTAGSTLPRSRASADALMKHSLSTLGPEVQTKPLRDQLEALRSISTAAAMTILPRSLPRRPRTEYIPAPGGTLPSTRPANVELGVSTLWGPNWDGVLISEEFPTLLAKGYQTHNGAGGLIVGYTIDEGTCFSFTIADHASLRAHIDSYSIRQRELVRDMYRLESRQDALCASYAAAALLGDAIFHGPILSLLSALSPKLAPSPLSFNDRRRPPRTWAYAFGMRPSASLLAGAYNNSDIVEEYFSILHTAELPLVFSYDGGDEHSRAAGDAYGVEADAPVRVTRRGKTNFDQEEVRVAAYVSNAWGAFVRGDDVALWQPTTTTTAVAAGKGVETLNLLTLGDSTQFGDKLPQRSKLIKVKPLGKTLFWRSRFSNQAASLAERMRLWMRPAASFDEFYGDPMFCQTYD